MFRRPSTNRFDNRNYYDNFINRYDNLLGNRNTFNSYHSPNNFGYSSHYSSDNDDRHFRYNYSDNHNSYRSRYHHSSDNDDRHFRYNRSNNRFNNRNSHRSRYYHPSDDDRYAQYNRSNNWNNYPYDLDNGFNYISNQIIFGNCRYCQRETDRLVDGKYCRSCYYADPIKCDRRRCKKKIKYIEFHLCKSCNLKYCLECYNSRHYGYKNPKRNECKQCKLYICKKIYRDHKCKICLHGFCPTCIGIRNYCDACWIWLICKKYTSNFPRDMIYLIIQALK